MSLSGGGDVVNAGELLGGAGGLYIQGTALNSDPNEERSGLTASVVNIGTIHGLGDFGGTYTNGYGVGFGSDMATATLVNSGTISSDFAEGVSHGTLADVTVTNEEGGVITGATSGIYSGSSGTLTVDNAGIIRSEEHTSELQSLIRNSYAVFCLKNKRTITQVTRKHLQR